MLIFTRAPLSVLRLCLAAIPGLMPEEMVAPVAESVGIRLLQKMGWRQGKGIGAWGSRNSSTGGPSWCAWCPSWCAWCRACLASPRC